MKVRELFKKRLMATFLCFAMVISSTGNIAFAEVLTETNFCEHHPVHTFECGYREASEGTPCRHIHDENCEYAESNSGIACDLGCKDIDDNGKIDHTYIHTYIHTYMYVEESANIPETDSAPCSHIHDEFCGYVEPIKAAPCTFVCDICAGDSISARKDNDVNNIFVMDTALRAENVGNATVTLQDDNQDDIQTIDIAEYTSGEDLSLTYKIQVKLTDAQIEAYIKSLTNWGNTMGSWSDTSSAQRFTIQFPAELFDQDLLEIDWSGAKSNSSSCMRLKAADTMNGIILEGNPDKENIFGSMFNFLSVTVPVTLNADNYSEAVEQGDISLDGTVNVNGGTEDANLPPLAFTAKHSLAVIDSNHPVGSLEVTDSNGSKPVFDGTSWILTDGEYTISGEAKKNEGLKVSGTVTLNLDNAVIEQNPDYAAQYAPAISIEPNSNVQINLVGNNVMQGSSGCAGIYVDEGSELTISGDGTLISHGGDSSEAAQEYPEILPNTEIFFCGGAGIGGNGVWAPDGNSDDVDGKWLDDRKMHFGTINIESGNIIAVGGKTRTTNAGAGAGIGSGGSTSLHNSIIAEPHEGTIHIIGGDITATGGDNENWSLTGGGAGIGAGGCTGGWYTQNNNIEITISSVGTIAATGKADGAGIGGGANVDSGSIEISAGTITATGGYEMENGQQDGAFGGAAIGGGDSGGASDIRITGGKITAEAIGGAAGIGGGQSGSVGIFHAKELVGTNIEGDEIPGEIYIAGDAEVHVVGGNHPTSTMGGAGIGSGYKGSVHGQIVIGGSAEVTAQGGRGAAGIGSGSFYNREDGNANGVDRIEINENAVVEASGTNGGAGIGSGRYGDVEEIKILGDASIKAVGANGAAGIGSGFTGGITKGISIESASVEAYGGLYSSSNPEFDGFGGAGIGSGVFWNNPYVACGTISITNGASVKAYAGGRDANAIGSGSRHKDNVKGTSLVLDDTVSLWAQTLDTTRPSLLNNGKSDVVYTSANTYLVMNNTSDKAEGWLTASSGKPDKEFVYTVDNGALKIDGTIVSAAMPVEPIGNWAVLYSDMVTPPTAVYKVEHYKQQKDGSYILADSESLYGEVGSTVSAAFKTYDGYSVNMDKSIISGEVFKVDDEATCLILKVYYDKTENPEKPENPENPEDTEDSENGSSGGDFQFDGTENTESEKQAELNKYGHFAYMSGYPDRTFRPDSHITRAEVMVMFSRLLTDGMDTGKTYNSSYIDVAPGMWYSNAVGFMEELGIVNGYSDGTFRPDAPISRAEFAAIAARFDKLGQHKVTQFTDLADDYWAKGSIERVYYRGWIGGYPDKTFRPDNGITRAEVVSIVNRMLERSVDKDYIDRNESTILSFTDVSRSHWAYYDIIEASGGCM